MNTPIKDAPRTIKVGRWTTAIGLIGIGVIVLLQLNHVLSFEVLKYIWPVLLILLGVEVVVANIIHSDKRVRLGGFSVTILILLLLVSTAQVMIPNLGTLFNKGYAGAIHGSTEIGSNVKRVEIVVDHGKVDVTGTDNAKVAYDGKFRFQDANTQKDADRMIEERWKVNTEGDTLVLSLNDDNNWFSFFNIEFDKDEEYLNVQIPKPLEVEVHTKNDSIKGRETGAGFTAVTTNGSINLTQIEGIVSATTSNSSITLEQIKDNVSATTTNGTVRVTDVGGSAQLKTSNSAITVNNIAGGLTAKTTNGSIKGTSAIGGDWNCSSSNGSISLGIPKNTNAEIKAKTTNSSIKGNISWVQDDDDKRSATIGDGTHKVELDTTNGSIKVNYGDNE
ncbi:LiaI-LiaF-like domain-containing protein [Paenibacillus sp.]|uniref:LiaI-LiaF-like domain-containing protein n=1 Tax=Paenibacillus sp. TaxID=58172 RepID=UPI00283A2D74|nr:DUF5668 domain-containing protein [Paenibacillus sp.]MDR0266686.1 DUF4097 family beta strand repeat-containing protein [Paenibacillus sp.]